MPAERGKDAAGFIRATVQAIKDERAGENRADVLSDLRDILLMAASDLGILLTTPMQARAVVARREQERAPTGAKGGRK